MPHKSRKGKAKFRGASRLQAQTSVVRPGVATTATSAPVITPPTRPATPAPASHEYVLGDLKLIGIIAGAMIVILIMLSFVLR